MAASRGGSTRSEIDSVLARFRLTPSEGDALRSEFHLVLRSCDFVKAGAVAEALLSYRDVPGIYFWLLRFGEREYKVYVGHTTSLAYRLSNYISEFQPHAPNDFKLRIFHAFAAEKYPGACLDLHFAPRDFGDATLAVVRAQLTALENKALADFKPVLLNKLAKASAESKRDLLRAFSAYYRSSFEATLSDPRRNE